MELFTNEFVYREYRRYVLAEQIIREVVIIKRCVYRPVIKNMSLCVFRPKMCISGERCALGILKENKNTDRGQMLSERYEISVFLFFFLFFLIIVSNVG